MNTRISSRWPRGLRELVLLLATLLVGNASACIDDPSNDGGGGRPAHKPPSVAAAGGGGATGQGGSGTGGADAASGSGPSSTASSGAGPSTSVSATTSTAGPTASASSGGPTECDTSQTVEDVIVACGETACAPSWSALQTCQAGCGVFPSLACMQQECFQEIETFSQCLSACPGYLICDPCLLACANLSHCGFASIGECYAICPSDAPDAVWACAASLTCDAIPLCQQVVD